MGDIFLAFEEFCKDPKVKSGKAASYANAIRYLCEFLNIQQIDSKSIQIIEEFYKNIKDTNNNDYLKCLAFLTARKQRSYLANGYIKAAIPQFINFYRKSVASTTKVEAIKEVIKLCGGAATWDDIYEKSPLYYPGIDRSLAWKEGIRGVLYRELSQNRTFVKNLDGTFSLKENRENTELNTGDFNVDFAKILKDSEIIASFDEYKTLGNLPTNETTDHSYSLSKINGTYKSGTSKIYSGRKAEKYFLDFLRCKGFMMNKDYYDVANNPTYGYDVLFLEKGIEIKNIRSGSFYLSDNEIAHIENNKTVLVLIDIDNGIWLLKKNSSWIKNIIKSIKEIREYCNTKHPMLDLTDIKININKQLENEVIEISQLSQQEIYGIINNN